MTKKGSAKWLISLKCGLTERDVSGVDGVADCLVEVLCACCWR